MKFEPLADLVCPDYGDDHLNRAVSDLVATYIADDAYLALYWVTEGCLAVVVRVELGNHLEQLYEAKAAADRRASVPDAGPESEAKLNRRAAETTAALQAFLAREIEETEETAAEATALWQSLGREYPGPVPPRYRPDRQRGEDPHLLEVLYDFWRQLITARKRLEEALEADRAAQRELAEDRAVLKRLRRFGLQHTARHDGDDVLELFRGLLARDGARHHQAGHGLLVEIASGRTVLLHVLLQPYRALQGEPVIVDAARVHQVAADLRRSRTTDSVVLLTNTEFSAPARRFATARGMKLLDHRALEAWALRRVAPRPRTGRRDGGRLMRIKRTPTIVPPKYGDRHLRANLGDFLAAATVQDMRNAVLYTAERTIALEVRTEVRTALEEARLVHRHSERRRGTGSDGDDGDWTPASPAYARSATPLLKELGIVIGQLEDSLARIEEACAALKRQYGHDADEAGTGPLRRLGLPWQQARVARARLGELLAADRENAHEVALREERYRAFLGSENSVSLQTIAAMSPTQFELAVAAFLRNDGFTVLRERGGAGDLGADVIAVSPEGQRYVIQCKHGSRRTAKVDSPDLQRLNGTARPVHGADVVVVVTNGTVTAPARAFARSQRIHCVERSFLERWAAWGQPLPELLTTC
ncbi:restriction endonuclease [Kitasatospora sp. NPDC001603]|uniref:restriction endonuclease n=1 Tax=Kitasatospora sp. NPDC001603 TaxID=3154388 RepID=UPI00332916BE